jgi:diguanylate cyclase (GGDEF)-like protein/PAS domain S-box-containing protein
MHPAGESSEPTQAGEAVASLRGLLELSRLTRRQPTLQETLRAVAETVSDALGFATTVVNVYRPEGDDYEVVAVHGTDGARENLLGRVTAADTWEPLLDPRFRRHGVYFIPEGSIDYDDSVRWHVPEPTDSTPPAEDSWRTDDALFATLDGAGGRRYGIISVDEPLSGRRPADHALEVLGALAAHAALVLESSLQMAALEAALARNRAVIASTLDSVIAVDADDRVIEFNPAAERTFGYRSGDVLGRPAVDLFVPPEIREAYVSGARRLRESRRSRLLDRRIETTAMSRDGTTFPVELTVTRVEGAEGEEPIFYAFVRDISERRRGEEQLAYLAYHDALTGLPNRLMVEQELDLALARARRSDGAAALMFVDLDDFKEVNDHLGHAAGDRLLAAVSGRLRGVLRSSDVLARQGGDEFLVLLADLDDDAALAAESVGAKLLEALREPFVIAGTEVRTGASIGISLYPADASDTEALLRHADAAMYQAKGAGGGRLAFHERSAQLHSRRAGVSGQLRAAIANGDLELHYQPLQRLDEGHTIAGVEALLRWRHPEREMLSPDEFMHLADQTSAGDELMNWVIAESCRQAREWLADDLVPLIGMNVSPQQLLSPGFVSRFDQQVRSAGVSAENFVLELTESAWRVDSAEALGVIADLRSAGATLLLDDFGAGYSSLSRLAGLAFDAIKVDGRMLAGVPGDATAVKLLEAVLDLVAAARSDVIAEGIETEAQVEFLTAHGVRYGQGAGLARPAPGAELTDALKRSLVRGAPPRRHR